MNCVIHTTKEWMELPDEVSVEGVWYVVSDYRTDNYVNVPRFKFGDGTTMISKLPFVTAAITENDVERWDESCGNDLGKTIIINKDHGSLVFPVDGYLMLEFEDSLDSAVVNIYGSGGKSFFTFSKPRGVNIHSKEVFVRKGMKCMYITASGRAKISFIPLI